MNDEHHDHGDSHGHGHHDHADLCWRSTAHEHLRTLREEMLERSGVERVALDAIAGRALAEPIVAETALPPHDHATMDGFAFDATDDYPLSIVDEEIFPEDEPPAIESGQAVRIATGAPLPRDANAVLKREDAEIEDGHLWGTAIEPGTYTYERGSNVAEGERLYPAGHRLSPKDALLLRDLGLEDVPVRERFSVGLLATGTEIHEGRQQDLDSPMLAGLVRSWGHGATYEGTVPDEYDRVRSRIEDLADAYDVVITTGGTSVGHKDYVIRVLEDLGEVLFHRVRIRPGKPIAASRLPNHDAVALAIPGKPIGAHAITTLVARPFFTGDADLPGITARIARSVDIAVEGFEYAIPVTLPGRDDLVDPESDVDDPPVAMPLGHVDSELDVYEEVFDPSVLSSSTRAATADGFVLTRERVQADEIVTVVPYRVVE